VLCNILIHVVRYVVLNEYISVFFFFFSSRRRHTRWPRDWSSDVCSSDLGTDSTSTLPASNSAVAVLISGMMRAMSESLFGGPSRSEERRVGKEGRSRGSP